MNIKWASTYNCAWYVVSAQLRQTVPTFSFVPHCGVCNKRNLQSMADFLIEEMKPEHMMPFLGNSNSWASYPYFPKVDILPSCFLDVIVLMILHSLEGLMHCGGLNDHTKANDFKYRSTTIKYQYLIPNFLLGICYHSFKLNTYKTKILVFLFFHKEIALGISLCPQCICIHQIYMAPSCQFP